MVAIKPILYLRKEEIIKAIGIKDVIKIMAQAFSCLAQGKIGMPARMRIDLEERKGLMLLMPCYDRQAEKISLKIIYQFAENPARGLPLIQSLLLLADEKDGQILSIMNGAVVTALRTGAVAGLATDYLARPEASRLAILGAGVQAEYQLKAMVAVRNIKNVRVFDVNKGAAETFARKLGKELGLSVEAVANPSAALKNADLACTATTSEVPVLEARDVEPGTHINAIGSWHPATREIPSSLILRSRIFVESRTAVMEEAGDLIMPVQEGLISKEALEDRLIELSDLVSGKAAGRESSEQVTLFKSVGLAVEDLFCASYVYDVCRRKGIGQALIP